MSLGTLITTRFETAESLREGDRGDIASVLARKADEDATAVGSSPGMRESPTALSASMLSATKRFLSSIASGIGPALKSRADSRAREMGAGGFEPPTSRV